MNQSFKFIWCASPAPLRVLELSDDDDHVRGGEDPILSLVENFLVHEVDVKVSPRKGVCLSGKVLNRLDKSLIDIQNLDGKRFAPAAYPWWSLNAT